MDSKTLTTLSLLLFVQGPGEWSLSTNLQARRVEA